MLIESVRHVLLGSLDILQISLKRDIFIPDNINGLRHARETKQQAINYSEISSLNQLLLLVWLIPRLIMYTQSYIAIHYLEQKFGSLCELFCYT